LNTLYGHQYGILSPTAVTKFQERAALRCKIHGVMGDIANVGFSFVHFIFSSRLGAHAHKIIKTIQTGKRKEKNKWHTTVTPLYGPLIGS